MMERNGIAATIRSYLEAYPKEVGLKRLLTLVESGGDVLSRGEARGHITCSALVIHPNRKVLQIHHRTLKRWLLPGGHVEAFDRSLHEAALRELQEEVGIGADCVTPLFPGGYAMPIDIDHHRIPANAVKAEPAHYHWDFRFAFRSQPVKLEPLRHEVTDAAWRDLSKLTAALRAKLRLLLDDESQWRAA